MGGGGGRCRRPNFSHDELSILTEEVSLNKSLLTGKFSETLDCEKKTELWHSIATKMNAVSVVERTAEEIRKKSIDCRLSSSVKIKFSKLKISMSTTGGGESEVLSFSALEDKVINILGKTAVEGLKQGVDTTIKQIKLANVLANSFGEF